MNNVPSWWEFLLVAAASWRSWQLLAKDDILNKPRAWALNLPPDWEFDDDDDREEVEGYRYNLADFITCPYCAGFWIAILWWLAWLTWPHATTLTAVPLALNTVVVLLAQHTNQDD